jgi:hypothetical protein
MSVLKFLATGKSLVGMKDRATPYRMRAANLLPKFESSKNPFAAPAKVEAAPISAPELPLVASLPPAKARGETLSLFDNAPQAEQTIPVVDQKSEPVKPTPPIVKAEPQPVVAPMVQKVVAAPMAVAPASPAVEAAPIAAAKRPALITAPQKISLLSVIKKLNPFTRLHKWSGNNSRSRAMRPPVQAELSLERIKVVRNDLNDADLEVVTARSTTAAGASAPKNEEPASGAPSAVLNRLNSRFLSSRPTQVH